MQNKISLKKQLSVTVAISAFNEEKNVGPFLSSILKQEEEGFIMEKIIVVSDGSTDRTASIVRGFKDKRIELREFKNRIGKSSRLNLIYGQLESDILIQSDSDVIFSHKNVIKNIVKVFAKDKKIGMCAGNPQPVNGVNFFEKADSKSFKIYSKLHKNIKNGRNVFTADGRILAYRRELVKKIIIPEDMISNDVYTYYCCLMNGFKYKYVMSAVVYFRCPQSMRDKIKQNKRSAATPLRMERYFPREVIKRESFIPVKVQIKSKLLQFNEDPLGSVLIFAINTYCKLNVKKEEMKLNAKWDISTSTKSLVN